MKKPDWSPRRDLDAKATQAAREAQNLPPGPERIEAMKKADWLRHRGGCMSFGSLISTKTFDNRSRLIARTTINSWPTRQFTSMPKGCKAK